MPDNLDFSLPGKKEKKMLFSPTNILVLILIVIMASVLAINLYSFFSGGKPGDTHSLTAAKLEEMALKLQKNHLNTQAAQVWENYLKIADLNTEKKSNIWYVTGKLYQEAGQYEKAIECYYTSELIQKNKNIEDEISLRVQECYENLGNFAGLRNELNQRVGLTENKDDVVLAEISDEKITASDLDKKIENLIDLQLSQVSPFMPEAELKKQKENLFKEYSGQDNRLKMLNQYIAEELLYREAMKEKIEQKSKVNDLLQNMKHSLYAQTYLNMEMAKKINITASDLKNYYEANKGAFVKDNRQLSFEEAKNDVYTAVLNYKESEVKDSLLQQLQNQYNVVMHSDKINQMKEQTDQQKK